MNDVESVYGVILNRNRQTAESYLIHSERLIVQMSQKDQQHWSVITQSLVEKGWHSWQCALVYIELSAEYQEKLGSQVLIQTGEFSLHLLELSLQSTLAYLSGIQIALEKDQANTIAVIENCGLSLKENYPQASNLLTEFYTTAFQLDVESDTLKTWCDAIVNFSAIGRQSVYEFVQLTNQYPESDWGFVSKLYLLSPLLGRSYVALSKGWLGETGETDETSRKNIENQFRGLLLNTAKTYPDIDWVQALALKALEPNKLNLAISLSKNLTDSHLVLALIEVADCLPDRLKALGIWVEEGRQLSMLNHAGGIAFLKLESKQGQRRLDCILGRIRFSEYKRALQMYVEGMSLVPLNLSESSSDLCYTQEKMIYLPSFTAYYESRMENFYWLKLGITHQLAAHEFGTFRFQYQRSSSPFSSLFHSFSRPGLASTLFRLLEAGRLDWRLAHRYAGIKQLLEKAKSDVVSATVFPTSKQSHELLRFILWVTLDGIGTEDELNSKQRSCVQSISILQKENASVFDTVKVLTVCYGLLTFDSDYVLDKTSFPDSYRGQLDLSSSFSVFKFELSAKLSPEESLPEDGDTEKFGPPSEGDISELVQGDAPEAEGIEQLESISEAIESSAKDSGQAAIESGGRASSQQKEKSYCYDEWDYLINDYRAAWCTLYEIKAQDEDREYVTRTLLELDKVSREVQKQLNKIRPELHKKVKGVVDGEELDLDRAIEAIVDRRSGYNPSDAIYVQKQKQSRDVAALFLLDMSASTDDVISKDAQHSDGNKIIDLEKKSVILMAEGLEKLGDRYAICGFSGYGRDRVEYTVYKSFEESYNNVTKARIGGIKPCRSTRMGPAIRHASKMLQASDAKVKTLIILSDGYPQDFDYGNDRSSKTYGIRDTAKSLVEASGLGVESFCLTVDPSGHDYLKEMCPAKKYMVIQDISQLPAELSKIYQELTSS